MTALETPQDAFDWLRRRRRSDDGARVSVDALQRVLRTAIPGVVPLQGARAGAASTTAFGNKQALVTATESSKTKESEDTNKEGGGADEEEKEDEDETLVAAIAACCALPAAVGREQQRDALRRFAVDTLQLSLRPLPATTNASSASSSSDSSDDNDVGSAWWRRVHRVRRAYFAARLAYFRARIELLRCAIERPRDDDDDDAQDASRGGGGGVVAQVVAQWTRDGLVDALVEELRGRRASLPGDSVYDDLGELLTAPAVERWLRVAQHEREQQLLHEELLLRELLLLALHVTHERLSLTQSMELVELLLVRCCCSCGGHRRTAILD
ncbi:hypothetical protein PINS_up011554 [Pythium insidiosum]|nr:hypothetical protein PINS_up011554 [Pythium insidiosum]